MGNIISIFSTRQIERPDRDSTLSTRQIERLDHDSTSSTRQIERPHHDSTSSTHDKISTPSNFETILNDALTKYANVTGYDLRDDPLASEIDQRDPLDKIVAIFEKQAKEFDDFRNDDPKLITKLKPVVGHLHKFFSSPAVTTGVDLVCPTNFGSFPFIFDPLS
jgi:hypothetical protein